MGVLVAAATSFTRDAGTEKSMSCQRTHSADRGSLTIAPKPIISGEPFRFFSLKSTDCHSSQLSKESEHCSLSCQDEPGTRLSGKTSTPQRFLAACNASPLSHGVRLCTWKANS